MREFGEIPRLDSGSITSTCMEKEQLGINIQSALQQFAIIYAIDQYVLLKTYTYFHSPKMLELDIEKFGKTISVYFSFAPDFLAPDGPALSLPE